MNKKIETHWKNDSVILEEKTINCTEEYKRFAAMMHIEKISNFPIEEVFSYIFNNSPGIINWKDVDLKFLGCSKANVKSFNLSSVDNLIGKTDRDFSWSNNGYLKIFNDEDHTVLSGKTLLILGRYDFSDEKKVILIRKQPMIDVKNNKIIGVISCCKEVPDLQSFIVHGKRSNLALSFESLNEINNKLFKKNSTVLFTPREEECLYYIIRGHSMKETAKKLGISDRTVEGYFEQVKNKLDCRKLPCVVAKAIELGYLYYVPPRIILEENLQ